MIEQRHVPVALAARRREAPRERRGGGSAAVDEFRADGAAPVAAIAAADPGRRAERDFRERRLRAQFHRVARCVGREREAHGIETQQKRIGPHVVGLERFLVERRRVVLRGFEPCAVKRQVAGHAIESLRPQRRHERLPLLDGDLGVTIAFDDQIALQHAVNERAAQVGFGLPAIVAAQEFERCESRDELHHRGWIHRARRVVREQRLRCTDFLHHQRNAVQRHVGVDECLADGAWQFGAGDARDQQRRGEDDGPRHAPSRMASVRVASNANSSSVTM